MDLRNSSTNGGTTIVMYEKMIITRHRWSLCRIQNGRDVVKESRAASTKKEKLHTASQPYVSIIQRKLPPAASACLEKLTIEMSYMHQIPPTKQPARIVLGLNESSWNSASHSLLNIGSDARAKS